MRLQRIEKGLRECSATEYNRHCSDAVSELNFLGRKVGSSAHINHWGRFEDWYNAVQVDVVMETRHAVQKVRDEISKMHETLRDGELSEASFEYSCCLD